VANPRKRSVALVIPHQADGSELLAVLRPPHDEELPGVWGLPAGSVRVEETPEDAALRVGRQKLGGALRLKGPIAVGEQERTAYALTMTLFRAELVAGEPTLPELTDQQEDVTYYAAWQWADAALLEEGALRGSLCCQLYLQHRQANASRP